MTTNAHTPTGHGRRPTLAHVAARAAVSVTTASYVLNGRATQMRISQAAISRVHQAAAELAYRPNRSARTLRTSTTATIGMITRGVASGQFANAMLSGAGAAAMARQHLLLIGETDNEADVEQHLVSELLDRQVDGLLLASVPTARTVAPELAAGTRVVLLNAVDAAGRLPAVLPDEVGGGRTAVEQVTRGRSRLVVDVVGTAPDTPDSLAGRLRMQGITTRLSALGHRLGTVVDCGWDVHDAYLAVTRWLDEREPDDHPRAVICLNDRIAMGTCQALAEHGLQPGTDLSLVSFDGSSLASWLRPSITSVGLPYAEMGALAVEVLLSDDPSTAAVHRVPMPVVEGESVLPAPDARSGRPPRRD